MAQLDALHPSYEKMLPLWREVRAVLFGHSEVTKLELAKPLYSKDVERTRVEQYLRRGRFLNATGWTHLSYNGMLWSVDPEIELNNRLEYLRRPLINIAQTITTELTSVGRYGVLIDAPHIDSDTVTIADSERNLPEFIGYKTEQIIDWHNGDIRLTESVERQTGEFEYETIEQIRRLAIIDGVYHNQVFIDNELVEDVIPVFNGSALDYIPFFIFGSDENTLNPTKPPLHDLAHYNIGHFLLDCDNRDNLFYHGQGQTNVFVEDGVAFLEANPAGLDTGAKGVNQFGKDDRVELLQLQATGAIPAEMQLNEQRMIMIGAQLVQDQASNKTLGATQISFNSSTSTLKQIAYNTGEGLTWLLERVNEMLNGGGEVFMYINNKFITDDLSAQDVTAVFAGVQAGIAPESMWLEICKRAGYTDKEIDELSEEALANNSEGMSEKDAEIELLREQLAALKAGDNGAE